MLKMNVGVVRTILLTALVLFGIIVVMILTGCIAGSLGASDLFFCKVYCPIGKGLLLAGLLFIAVTVVRELRTNS